jgi:hypothetical protein
VVIGRLDNWWIPKLRVDIDMLLLSSCLVEGLLRYRKLSCREVVDVVRLRQQGKCDRVHQLAQQPPKNPKCPSTSFPCIRESNSQIPHRARRLYELSTTKSSLLLVNKAIQMT